MKRYLLFWPAAILLVFSVNSLGQTGIVVVHDPTKPAAKTKMTPGEETAFDRALVPVRRAIKSEVCSESVDISGIVHGAFSRTDAVQTLVFYQYCQTGNGFGEAGLVLIENDNAIDNFIADAGWTLDIGRVADVNKNGLDEFTLAYSGGLHQGQGGAGVDLMEFANGMPAGLGWYKSEEYNDTQVSSSWKLTAKSGPTPVFYRQKFTSRDGTKWRAVGAASAFKLGSTYSKFEVVK